jgi:glutamyl endopeptidase
MPEVKSVSIKPNLGEATVAPTAPVVLKGDAGKGSDEHSRSLKQLVVKGKQPLPVRRPTLENILHPVDQRVRVLDTELLPWRMICRLRIQSKAGEFVGTGSFAGPKTVVTAGHCIFASQMSGAATSITVIPGQSAGASPDQPFGFKTSTNFSTTDLWKEQEDPDFDIGCIHLAEAFNPHPGVFSTAVFSTEELRGFLVNVAGYPADKGGDKLFHHANQILAATDRRIFYAIDTMGGQSGAPVWLHESEDGPPVVVGIHAYSEFATPSELQIRANSAPRIIPEVFELIKGWVEADNAG